MKFSFLFAYNSFSFLKGEDGVKGESPYPPPFFVVNPWKNKFPIEKRKMFNYLLVGRNRYTVLGMNSKKPGDGSDGGHGGMGGHPGNESLIFFNKQPKFLIRKSKGVSGKIFHLINSISFYRRRTFFFY